MPTLWLKFPDEAIFYAQFNDAEKKRLESIFSAADKNSAWNRALCLLGFSATKDELIRWHQDAPYFNWSALIKIISGGAIQAVQSQNDGYRFHASYSPGNLWALFVSQWKMARFLAREALSDDRLAESLALGLGLQALMIRLGAEAVRLAVWLAQAAPVPPQYKKTVQQIQAVQVRRTQMSQVWKEFFPDHGGGEPSFQNLPDYFWDEPPAAVLKNVSSLSSDKWTGLPVCTGRVTGIAVMDMEDIPGIRMQYQAPLILVFRRAQPKTTEMFDHAAALLFAEGGVMSHACTIARERNIPAVTALGESFFTCLKREKPLWLSVDGGTGEVNVINEVVAVP